MALYHSDIIDIDLESGTVHRSFSNRIIGEGDNNANRYGFRLRRGGEPVSLAGGACVGYFIRNDGITLVITGMVSNDVAYVELPEAAYAAEGNFSLAIKLTGPGFAGTMRIVDGTVVNTTTEAISDPSSEIPSIEDLLAVIERAEDAATDINSLSVTVSQIAGTRYKVTVTKG